MKKITKLILLLIGLVSLTEASKVVESESIDGIRETTSPHKITLDESQKGEGKSNLVFTQDDQNYYYILVTKPLPGVDRSQFAVNIYSDKIDVKLVAGSPIEYSVVVNLVKPVSHPDPRAYEISPHPDNTFTIHVKLSKGGENDDSIKTHYEVGQPVKVEKKEEKKEEPIDPLDKGANNFVDALNNGLKNPAWKMEANIPKIDEEEIKGQFEGELKETTKLLDVIDQKQFLKDMDLGLDAEKLKKDAEGAMNDLENGKTDKLEGLVNSLPKADSVMDKGKSASKKQLGGKENKDKQQKMKNDINQKKDSGKDKEKMVKEQNKKKEQESKDQGKDKSQDSKDDDLIKFMDIGDLLTQNFQNRRKLSK